LLVDEEGEDLQPEELLEDLTVEEVEQEPSYARGASIKAISVLQS
jgi:hypothetical protein